MTGYLDNWGEDGRTCVGECGQFLPWESFSPRKRGKNGRTSVCRSCTATRKRNARAADPEKFRAADRDYERRSRRHVRRTYGILPAEYDRMVKAQKGRCGACGRLPRKRLVVDHCHRDGHVRALVCDNCNVSAGLMGDDPAALRKLADYIENN